jgi:hypothetical protein
MQISLSAIEKGRKSRANESDVHGIGANMRVLSDIACGISLLRSGFWKHDKRGADRDNAYAKKEGSAAERFSFLGYATERGT